MNTLLDPYFMNIPSSDLPRIVVLGAGFGGLHFAKSLAKGNYQVVLIDKNNYHTFQPLMYQVASSGLEPDSIAYPIRKVFQHRPNFYFRLAEIEEVDFTTKTVSTSIGNIQYDKLVIATGAKNNFFGNKSIEENAMSMKSLKESLDLRSKILENFEKALNTHDLKEFNRYMHFVIVGGGPTGVELAGALAELRNKILPKDFPDIDFRKMRISIIEGSPRVLNVMSDNAASKAQKFLKELGVEVFTETRVNSYDGHTVVTDNLDFETDTMIWAAGVTAAPPKGIDPVLIVRGNRIEVNEFLEVKCHDNVYSIGDVSHAPTDDQRGYPMLGSVAMQQGVYLANQLNKELKGKKLKPFVYNDKGTMATVGRNLAVVDLPNFKFSGTFAWFVWMLVHLMLLVGFRNRAVVFINWTWNYFRYENGNRIIVRPYRKKKSPE